jgi:hypothetical protein
MVLIEKAIINRKEIFSSTAIVKTGETRCPQRAPCGGQKECTVC